MITVFSVGMILLIMLMASVGFGKLIAKEKSVSFQIIVGFCTVLGLIEISDLVLMCFSLNKLPMYACYVLTLGAGCLCCFMKKTEFSMKWTVGLLGYLVFMILMMCTRTIGEPNFDSVFYLSYVNEWADSLLITPMAYETGSLMKFSSLLYDYQAYYHLNSFFLWVIQSLHTVFLGSRILVSQIYVWSMNIWFYVLLFCFNKALIEMIGLKNHWLKAVVTVFVLGVIGNFYWNNSLAFFRVDFFRCF